VLIAEGGGRQGAENADDAVAGAKAAGHRHDLAEALEIERRGLAHRDIGAIGTRLGQRGAIIDGARFLDADDGLEKELDLRAWRTPLRPPHRWRRRLVGEGNGGSGTAGDGIDRPLDLVSVLLQLWRLGRGETLDRVEPAFDLHEFLAERRAMGTELVEAALAVGWSAVALGGAAALAVTPAPDYRKQLGKA